MSALVDLSLELPLVLEFYDEPDRIMQAIEALQSGLHFEHIVSWPAEAYLP